MPTSVPISQLGYERENRSGASSDQADDDSDDELAKSVQKNHAGAAMLAGEGDISEAVKNSLLNRPPEGPRAPQPIDYEALEQMITNMQGRIAVAISGNQRAHPREFHHWIRPLKGLKGADLQKCQGAVRQFVAGIFESAWNRAVNEAGLPYG